MELGRDEEGVQCLTKAIPIWTAFDFDDLQERFQDTLDWYGEFMCLKPDTGILTDEGWRDISSIKKGDIVFSHTGKKRRVLQTFKREAQKLLDITVNGRTVTITKEHPVLALRNAKEEWVPAGELVEGDFVVVIPHGKL